MDRDEHLDWRCRMGRHHYEIIADPNPEVRGGSLRKCTRCEHESENEIKLRRAKILSIPSNRIQVRPLVCVLKVIFGQLP